MGRAENVSATTKSLYKSLKTIDAASKMSGYSVQEPVSPCSAFGRFGITSDDVDE